MKNLLISALVAVLIHVTDFIINCTSFEYFVVLFGMAAACFALLELVDYQIRQLKSRGRRPIRRWQYINFDVTKIN